MIIYTDGSAHPNPGPGGFGVVVLDNDENLITCYTEQSPQTTNNREELKAILYAMKHYGLDGMVFPSNTIVTDSSYSMNTLTNWMFSWERNGWIKSDKKVPENLDIIKEYYDYVKQGYKVEFKLIRGHKGNIWNELADSLATGKITPEEGMKLYGRK